VLTTIVAAAVVLAAIAIETAWLTRKIAAIRAQIQTPRRDLEPTWQWPPRPVNGHDHPEPEELTGERA
jgi:hypothetical protein